MKKIISLMAIVLTISVSAFATDLARIPGNIVSGPGTPEAIQVFAPSGAATTTLSVNSSTTSLSGYIMYSLYSASGTCYLRLMPTSTKSATYTAVPIPNTTWHTRAVNVATPFANLSGCVGGFIQKQ